MKLFQCQCCGQVLHFENTVCLRCGHTLGYLPGANRMAAVEPDGAVWRLAGETDPQRWRFCKNWELSACNWMVPGTGPEYCAACRHNRTIPGLSNPENHRRWQRIEAAKRRLIYTLSRLGLPRPAAGGGHPEPLVFDFLADDPGTAPRVLTGHAGGVVTISLTEADDAEREAMRSRMGEAYRTLLGHFRHEIGHYYWDLLVRDGGALEAFRTMFGDERADYAAALDRHYRHGPPPGWEAAHVSAYAAMHPWEDWAETWAHYLHMTDTLETAAAFGMRADPEAGGDLAAGIGINPFGVRDIQRLLGAWLPLTVALNAMNRSMGQPDLYPFALPQPVLDKLGFVHDLVTAQAGDQKSQSSSSVATALPMT